MSSSNPSSNAAATFDPYYTWLGIPPRDQPPHHYRLLGVDLFEANRDVIDNAANRQMTHLRLCSVGARANFAQELLNHVAAARICLLDENRKVEYDSRLRQQLAPPIDLVPDLSPAISSRRTSVRLKNPTVEVLKVVLGGLVGLAVGYVVLLVVWPEKFGWRPKLATATRAKSSNQTTSPTPPTESDAATSARTTSPESDPSSANRSSSQPAEAVENVPVDESDKPLTAPPVPPNNSTPKKKKGKGKPGARPAESTPLPTDLDNSTQQPASAPIASINPLPTSVSLPPQDATSWQTLIPLSKSVNKIELIPAFDPTVAKVSLSLESAGTREDHNWRIQFEVPGESSTSERATLAELQIEPSSGDLQFRWQAGNPQAAAALSNSWLKFDLESTSRFLALRHAQLVAPLKVDFEKERYVLPLSIESIPATDHVYLEMAPVTGLPGGALFRNGVDHGKLDREVVIEFSDLPGAQVGIKLSKVPQAPLGLIVEPRFKDGPSREFDLTFTQLEKTRRSAMEAVQEARAEISGLTNNLNSAQSALQAAQNRKVSNGNQARQKVFDVIRLEGTVRDLTKELDSLREQEAVAQSRLDNVPKVMSFMRSLQGAAIPFRVVVKTSVAELILAKGTTGDAK